MSHRILKEVAERHAEEFQRKFERYLDPETTCGLRLSFDPLWEALRNCHGYLWNPYHECLSLLGGVDMLDDFLRGWESKRWESLNRRWHRLKEEQNQPPSEVPINFHLYFRSDEARREAGEMPRQFLQFGVVADVRPPAAGMAISLAASDQVGRKSPANHGTLGGFLRDGNTGTDYAVTCAHVCSLADRDLMHPGPAKKNTVTQVGRVIHSVVPPPSGGARSCYAPWPNPGALDFSLSEVDPSVSTSNHFQRVGSPVLFSPISAICKSDQVEIFAEQSGRVDAEVAMYSIHDEILIDGQKRCFSDIFTLTPPKPFYLNRSILKPGDSGGWVLCQRAGVTSWDGMVFACDGATAYACYAENIVNEARKACSGIKLPP